VKIVDSCWKSLTLRIKGTLQNRHEGLYMYLPDKKQISLLNSELEGWVQCNLHRYIKWLFAVPASHFWISMYPSSLCLTRKHCGCDPEYCHIPNSSFLMSSWFLRHRTSTTKVELLLIFVGLCLQIFSGVAVRRIVIILLALYFSGGYSYNG